MSSLHVVAAVLLLGACSAGDPFEHGSSGGSGLASAQGGAGAPAAAGSPELGGAAGAAAEQPPGGAGGAAGAQVDPAAGAGGVQDACQRSTWSAVAFATAPSSSPLQALDGAPATAWSSGQSREPGQWFRLELGDGVELHELELTSSAPELLLELDDAAISTARDWPAPGVVRLRFEATPASSARLVLPPASSAPEPWSISEVAAACD